MPLAPGWKLLAVGGRANMGEALHAMFHPDPHELHWFKKQGLSPADVAAMGERFRKQLHEEIRSGCEENYLISAESLSVFNSAGIENLRTFLLPLFDEVRVIGYVRPSSAYKVSMFQQRVKHGTHGAGLHSVRPHYRSKFRKFDKIFGRKNVVLRKFDVTRFSEQCIVRDFCRQIGLPIPPETVIDRNNESLCKGACAILCCYRKYGPGYGVGRAALKENMALIRSLLEMKGAKFQVASSALYPSNAKERGDIEWMEQRLGESLDETPEEGQDAIRDEAELLCASREDCLEFIRSFSAVHGLLIPENLVPAGPTVDGPEVARIVEAGRQAWKASEEKPAKKKTDKRSRISLRKRVARAIRRFRKRVGKFVGRPEVDERISRQSGS